MEFPNFLYSILLSVEAPAAVNPAAHAMAQAAVQPVEPPEAVEPIKIMVTQQMDGHPEVVLKTGPGSAEAVVAKIPNRHPVDVLSDDGSEYIKIRYLRMVPSPKGGSEWWVQEGYIRRANVMEVPLCETSCCTRPSAPGFRTCCRTCDGSTGAQHGPQCMGTVFTMAWTSHL